MTHISDITVCTTRPQPRTSILTRIMTLLSVRRQRRALRDMPSHMLADIGISRGQALTEAQKPLWDVPQNWRR